ncbi:hypothetical protein LNQ03_27185 [Klebsiella pneumoniae subsp. pneumoniae]|nr:hypothetical protein [Klebsiella pneumoniae subsp. pneumoniae]
MPGLPQEHRDEAQIALIIGMAGSLRPTVLQAGPDQANGPVAASSSAAWAERARGIFPPGASCQDLLLERCPTAITSLTSHKICCSLAGTASWSTPYSRLGAEAVLGSHAKRSPKPCLSPPAAR